GNLKRDRQPQRAAPRRRPGRGCAPLAGRARQAFRRGVQADLYVAGGSGRDPGMVSVPMLAEMSQGMRAPIQVNELALLASGGNRLVYRHPDEPRHLIKVFRTEHVNAHWGPHMRLRERLRRLRQYELFNREIQEYLSAHASDPRALAFTQKIV